MAEVLLAKEEQSNKQLLENSIRQEKRATELEKRLKEIQIYHERLKEDTRKTEALLIQRDSQMKQLLGKINSLERELIGLTEEMKKKESLIEQLKRNLQTTSKKAEVRNSIIGLRQSNTNSANQMSAKESELKLMKEMMKSYHVQYRQKTDEVTRFKRSTHAGVKLPNLSTRTSETLNESPSPFISSKTDIATFEVQEADFEESYPEVANLG